jgi:prolyl-tRNA synthetase
VVEGDPSPDGRGRLGICRGIEVGHIFQLRSKYSESMNATFLDEAGQSRPMEMGCYGIGVSRIVAAAIEQGHDEHGIIFPMALAPFQIGLIPIAVNDPAVWACVERLHADLEAEGVEVLLDDRDERPGVKFKDCDLLGIPLRVVVGPKTLDKGQAELKERNSKETKFISLNELPNYLVNRIKELAGQEG